MKRKIFGAALIAAMAVAAGWNFNQSKNEVRLSELALTNVEALAQGESLDQSKSWCCGNNGTCYINWAENYKVTGDFRVTPC